MSSTFRVAFTLLFVALPLLEIAVLIKVGAAIGVLPTIGLLILAAVAGMFVIRAQGVSMVSRMFAAMNEGRMPLAAMIDGYAAIVAGFLLIIPGFITDFIGLLLLIPPVRRFVIAWSLTGFTPAVRSSPRRDPAISRPDVIDATYERVEDPRDDGRRRD
jgi:UPF0716 protein FxsA